MPNIEAYLLYSRFYFDLISTRQEESNVPHGKTNGELNDAPLGITTITLVIRTLRNYIVVKLLLYLSWLCNFVLGLLFNMLYFLNKIEVSLID